MKITFLGTSHGVPDKERYCQCILLESGGAGYLIDAGAPVVDLLIRRGFDISALRAVFTTHAHGDHTDGLLGLLDLTNWYFKDSDYDVYMTEPEIIQCYDNLLRTMFRGSECYSPDRIRFKLVRQGLVYEDTNIKVTAVPTKHMLDWGRPSFGYIIECEGKKVYVSGDLNGKLIDYDETVNREEIDAFVVESAHFPIERLIDKLKSCRAKRVMIVHGYRPEIARELEAFRKEAPFELSFPSDGQGYII